MVAFGISEGFVRIYKRNIAFQPDPELIRSLRPNVKNKVLVYETQENLNSKSLSIPDRLRFVGMDYTNNVGLRMSEDIGPKEVNEKRILLLGDSFTEAEGVPDSQRFYYLLNQTLKKRPGVSRWRVLNAGIQNGCPSQYILQLRQYLTRFNPDIVIVFLAPNDLTDDLNFERAYGYEFDSENLPSRPKTRLKLSLLRNFWVLRYLEVFLTRHYPKGHQLLFPPASRNLFAPDWHSLLCTEDAATRQLFLEKTGQYLLGLKRMVESSHAKLGVFLIHYMDAFDHEPFYIPAFPHREEELRSWGCHKTKGQPFNSFIDHFLMENGIKSWNPYERLLREKNRDPKRKLWNFHDYHFSPAGHEVIADELLKFLDPSLQE